METSFHFFLFSKMLYICFRMQPEKDWILENIKKIIKEKGLKVENVSNAIGISKGEFSKILSGQRDNYPKYLPQIADSLEVSFHQLVTPNNVILNNYGEIKEQSQGQVANMYNSTDKVLYERLINECNEKDKTKDELLKTEREAKENYKRKYEAMKAKVQELEKKISG